MIHRIDNGGEWRIDRIVYSPEAENKIPVEHAQVVFTVWHKRHAVGRFRLLVPLTATPKEIERIMEAWLLQVVSGKIDLQLAVHRAEVSDVAAGKRHEPVKERGLFIPPHLQRTPGL
jgi:hypothetical protein